MRADQPVRGSHPPGTFWYYNNWDFDALGTIFEKQFHTTIGADFDKNLARPLQMQDFSLQDKYYLHASPDAAAEDRSQHPAYHFRISARDLARFGYLYLNQGTWKGKQVVPKAWAAQSTRSYSDAGDGAGLRVLMVDQQLWSANR